MLSGETFQGWVATKDTPPPGNQAMLGTEDQDVSEGVTQNLGNSRKPSMAPDPDSSSQQTKMNVKNTHSSEVGSAVGGHKNSMQTTGGTMNVAADQYIKVRESQMLTHSQIGKQDQINETNEDDEQDRAAIEGSKQAASPGGGASSGDLNENAYAEERRDRVAMNDEDSLLSNTGVPQQLLNSGEMPSDEDLETYRIVFELFDRDRSGFIDNHDLAAISVKLNKDPSEGKIFGISSVSQPNR